MRHALVIGNWKMNGSLQQSSELLHTIDGAINDKITAEIGVCVPFVYIDLARRVLGPSNLKTGAQTLSEFKSGAYTGEVSADMLAEFDCYWVLVGHSERRQFFSEKNGALVLKVIAAQKAGLTPVYCVGETEAEYKAGDRFKVIDGQLQSLLANRDVDLKKLVLAYEPVWAIGTGMTASPEDAQEVHAFIRELIKNKAESIADKIRILYGGSVNANNAASLFAQQDIDGGLIGGASLDADAFISICQKA